MTDDKDRETPSEAPTERDARPALKEGVAQLLADYSNNEACERDALKIRERLRGLLSACRVAVPSETPSEAEAREEYETALGVYCARLTGELEGDRVAALRALDSALFAYRAAVLREERARIVAWLRGLSGGKEFAPDTQLSEKRQWEFDRVTAWMDAADALGRGEHVKEAPGGRRGDADAWLAAHEEDEHG